MKCWVSVVYSLNKHDGLMNSTQSVCWSCIFFFWCILKHLEYCQCHCCCCWTIALVRVWMLPNNPERNQFPECKVSDWQRYKGCNFIDLKLQKYLFNIIMTEYDVDSIKSDDICLSWHYLVSFGIFFYSLINTCLTFFKLHRSAIFFVI